MTTEADGFRAVIEKDRQTIEGYEALADLCEGTEEQLIARIKLLYARKQEADAAHRQLEDRLTSQERAAESAITRLQQDLSEAQRKWDELWEALENEAHSRGWCDEYDDFAQCNGGQRREQGYEVMVDVTIRTKVVVSVREYEQAKARAVEQLTEDRELYEGTELRLTACNGSVVGTMQTIRAVGQPAYYNGDDD